MSISADSDPRARKPCETSRTRCASLWPKEHGAYGQLFIPLLASMIAIGPSVAGAAIAVASICAFLAHEPVVVLLGHRGPKARRTLARAAWIRTGILVSSAAAATTVACALSPSLLAALVPVGLNAALVAGFVWRRNEKTLFGEVAAASALASAGFLVLVAAGAPWRAALTFWAVWVAGNAAATASVRTVIASFKGNPERASGVVLAAATAAPLALLAAGRLPMLAAVPMVIVAWAIVALKPHPRALRKVGWSLVAATTTTALLTVVLLRRGA